MKRFSFENLIAWQKAIEVTKQIYKVTQDFPRDERFGLISQLRRSVTSVASNLAEGSARQTSKDKAHFTLMGYSSLMETINHIIIAQELEYLRKEDYTSIRQKTEELSRILTALRKSQLRT